MNPNSSTDRKPHLIWLYTGALAETLDAATWLQTTAELRKLGWQVTLVVAGPVQQHKIDSVEVWSIPKADIYLLRQLLFHLMFLWLFMRCWSSADIIMFHQMSAPWILPLRLVRRLLGKHRPLLVMDTRTIHMEPQTRESLKARLRRIFYNWMNQIANRWTDGQTTISQRMAQAVQVPAHQLWGSWPSGVTLEPFAEANILRQWPKDSEPIRLIYIGSLHHERNLTRLCQAVIQANQEGCSFCLTLVGDGTARAELARFATQSEPWIRLLAPVPHRQVPALLAEVHVGTLPFPDEEKFRVSSPIKLFEYLAAGLPILATRIVCHTDVIRGGDYVIWSENGSVPGLTTALHDLWKRREALPAMGCAAAAAAPAWTWASAAQQLKVALEHGLQQVA